VNAVSATDEPCTLLPWDTEFFGRRIARVRGDSLTKESAGTINAWCHANGIEAIYFIARSDDPMTVAVAEAEGYHLVDVRMTFDRVLGKAAAEETPQHSQIRLREAKAEDLPDLQAIARLSHGDTRFGVDPHFSKQQCENLYAVWIESSLRTSAVNVAEHRGKVVGYVTKDEGEPDEGRIGLIAVSLGARGLGIGKALVDEAVKWFAAHGKRRVTVVTQGRNLTAQRLYGRSGFIARDVQLYYHRWFARGE
jgi:dTDP-4-amino-4,6-dideoxy-D-galactose acyltransferase